MNALSSLRKELDQIDTQIVNLLNKRMRLTAQVSEYKDDHHLPLFDAEREKAIISQVKDLAENPVLRDRIESFFHLIMDAAKDAGIFGRKVPLPFTRIGIIGLGLIGGSIANGLKAKDPALSLLTIVREGPDNQLALKSGLLEKEAATLSDLIQNADFIVVAVPISAVIPIAKEIVKVKSLLKKKLIVIDVASVKGGIAEEFEKLSDNAVEFVATHPMAGMEKRGFENSKASLFVDAPWIITPHKNNTESTLEEVKGFIQYLGAIPMEMPAETHDKKMALVSHVPGIVSTAFLDFVLEFDPNSLEVSGPGFRSVTRLAHDNPEMRAEIAAHNQLLISQCLNKWIQYLQKTMGTS